MKPDINSPAIASGPSADVGEDFAKCITSIAYGDLPSDVVEATKRSILDTLACILAGSTTATIRAARELVASWGGTPQATVINSTLRLPSVSAGAINAAMAHQYDFDDTHDRATTHPTANTLPAALAVAESIGNCDGRDLIRAVALGNDIVCRLGLAIEGSLFDYNFLWPATLGAFGATAAACSLLKMTEAQIQSSFGLCLHQTSGTLEAASTPDSDVRGFRDFFAVRSGISATLLAHAGLQGGRTAFEGRFGLFNAFFRGEYDRSALTVDLGKRFEGAFVSLKPWPAFREAHALLHAVLELREREKIAPDDVVGIQLFLGPTNFQFCERAGVRRPKQRMDALNSIPFGVAVALWYGDVPLAAYQDPALHDTAILSLIDRISWRLDASLDQGATIEPARVRITLRDGREFAGGARHGLGHPENPLPRALLRRKFADCASLAKLPLSRSNRIVDVVEYLERCRVADLSAALTA